jgi:hypothetical protein
MPCRWPGGLTSVTQWNRARATTAPTASRRQPRSPARPKSAPARCGG